jgi:glycine betaine/proline transport system substrate-binding protein
MKRLIGTIALIASATLGSAAAQAQCGTVTIAEMTWNSAAVTAQVDRFILEHGYGCDAQLVPGDTVPTGTSMTERGEPDVAPELWTNSFTGAIDLGVTENRLRIANSSLPEGGQEGFWVPKFMVDRNPELATIEGIIANADLFTHPEDRNKNGFWGCPSGWACQISSGNLFTALGLEGVNFEYVDPGSGATLASSIARAFERDEPWFGYYWAPTDIVGKFDMVLVDFGSGVDEQHFLDCISQEVCENPQVTMYPVSPIKTVVVEDFAARAPGAFDYLNSRSFTNKQMGALLAWMADNQAEPEFGMEFFLTERDDIWTNWVPSDVADKVRSALANL